VKDVISLEWKMLFRWSERCYFVGVKDVISRWSERCYFKLGEKSSFVGVKKSSFVRVKKSSFVRVKDVISNWMKNLFPLG
jgi:hypothetical protein